MPLLLARDCREAGSWRAHHGGQDNEASRLESYRCSEVEGGLSTVSDVLHDIAALSLARSGARNGEKRGNEKSREEKRTEATMMAPTGGQVDKFIRSRHLGQQSLVSTTGKDCHRRVGIGRNKSLKYTSQNGDRSLIAKKNGIVEPPHDEASENGLEGVVGLASQTPRMAENVIVGDFG